MNQTTMNLIVCQRQWNNMVNLQVDLQLSNKENVLLVIESKTTKLAL
jgi:hypothetical protein